MALDSRPRLASHPSHAASLVALTLLLVIGFTPGPADAQRRDRFRTRGVPDRERGASDPSGLVEPGPDPSGPQSDAPTGFDNLTNGYLPQGPPFEEIDDDNVQALASFNDDRFLFEEFEAIEDGLGPTYNAQSCRECHQNVVTGGGSQVAEQRTGRLENGRFFESIGGTLIHSRAIHPDIVERVSPADGVRTFRLSTSTLGDGFVEAISNSTLLAIRDRQPRAIRGTAVPVPVLEADGQVRIGRFGWKAQHASLVSFSADAYLNEMGITTPLLPEENTASGVYVGVGSGYDEVLEPEDDGVDVVAFADFMRATKAPPRGEETADARAGEAIFARIGCEGCHVATIVTAPAGTAINGGELVVPEALGHKAIHPYSDFLLHDVGSGDGIPVLPGRAYASTASQIRTAPLWGLRTRNRLMHDGLALTPEDAIARHGGQAAASRAAFARLPAAERRRVLAFLDSL
ncbi:MAG: di-heme oxidoredictase family protein [Myxococcota bacterium]